MLRASVKDPQNPLILMGLTEDNVARLKAGFPIRAELTSFGVAMPGQIAVMYGYDEYDLQERLKAGGIKLPAGADQLPPATEAALRVRREHAHILIATVGLPRAGKSTWARSQSYPVVCPDAVRLAMHGRRFAVEAEPFVWAVAKCMVRALFMAGHKTVILDATNVSRKRRDEWRSPEWGTYFKVFNTSPALCITRAERQGDTEILPVIDRMAGEWQNLADDEPVWQ